MKIQSIKPQLTPLSTFWSEDAQNLRIPTIQRQFDWDGVLIPESLLDTVETVK